MSVLSSNPERVSIEVGGAPYEVNSLSGEERLSSLFKFEVECTFTGMPPSAPSLIGQDASITLRDGLGNERRIAGVVSNAKVRVFDNDKGAIHVVVRPHAWTLTVGRDCRAFQDSTVVDITREIMNMVRGPKRFETIGSYHTRVYTVQYREDGFTFVSRLLEDEGIYYWFDHDAGSAIVFSDESTNAPDAPGGPLIQFAYESGITADREIVEELQSESRVVPSKFTVGSFDFNRPLLKVQGTTGSGPFEIYDAPGGGPESPEVCQARARVGQEGARAAGAGVAGKTTSIRLYPGVAFELFDHPVSRLDGRYLVTGVRYKITQRKRNTSGASDRPYECELTAIRSDVHYRPPAEAPKAKQAGAQSGMVIGQPGEEIYVDNLARVRVQQYWDRLGTKDHASGKWMRVAQRGSAESMLFPRIGWTVLTFNEEGDTDAPSVFNRIPDAEHMPPYPLPENKTRTVFKTATTPGGGTFNEIRLEDKKGVEEMFINASRDMNILIQHIKTGRVFNDQSRAVGANHSLMVGSHYLTMVGHDQTVSIDGNESISVQKGKTSQTDIDETVTIGANRTISIGNSFLLATEKTRKLKVGAAMIDVSLGTISTDGGVYTLLAGGAVVKASNQTISEDVGKVSVQVIGGVKLEKAKQNRATDVKKQYYENVGGAMTLKTSGKYIDNAQKLSSWRVAAKLAAKAPSMLVEAKDKIVLRCGSSTITIVPGSVEIKASSYDLSGATLDYDTKLVKHN
jgi:type VI secretion system secreted protein VgrG